MVSPIALARIGSKVVPTDLLAVNSWYFFSAVRMARRKCLTVWPDFSIRLILVSNTSLTVLIKPGIALSGHEL